MTLLEAIEARHSVRRYKDTPLSEEQLIALKNKIDEVNAASGLHLQLVTNEPKAFKSLLCYGSFSGVNNYVVVAGKKTEELDEKAGYFGEQMVLLAQQLGLNTCWAGLTYQKVDGAYTINEGEKIVCLIALGYGTTQGTMRRHKALEAISNVSNETPDWFKKGVEAAQLAPTAVNQQKFYFAYIGKNEEGKGLVIARKSFSLMGYTKVDLGIAKLHFEIGAGKENFEWDCN